MGMAMSLTVIDILVGVTVIWRRQQRAHGSGGHHWVRDQVIKATGSAARKLK